MRWYFKVIKNYLFFEGRARRMEFWMFFLINSIIYWLLDIWESFEQWGTLLTGFYSLFIFFPALAVGIRRLHDIGRSGWWTLISFIPIVGPLTLFVFSCFDSEDGSNEYGPNPKYN